MTSKIILEAGKTDREYFKDLWRYRELFYVLARRDLAVRYKQTAVGVVWAVVRPLLSTLVLTVVFSKLGRFPSHGVPYVVLVLSGMLPWQLFSSALTESGGSLVANANLITKVYFPRLIVPGSSLVTSCADFAVSLGILAVLMCIYGVAPTWRLLLLPVVMLFALVTAGSIGVWVAALNVRYRDFAFVVPFVTQLGLYLSPVAFSSSVVPPEWRALYSVNPMVGVIDGFRWCVLGTGTPMFWGGLAVSAGMVLVMAVTGVSYFRRTERTFADLI
jgi:lipopolysaccharide transport system permease protein